MARRSGWMAVAAVAAMGLPAAGCQFVPRDETPNLPPQLANLPDAGPSAQRRDAAGWPMLGAFPNTATAQVSDEEVAATRARQSRIAGRGAGSTAPSYQRDVNELQALAARQRARGAALDAEPAAAAGADASSRAQ